jgi:hypothetical protein
LISLARPTTVNDTGSVPGAGTTSTTSPMSKPSAALRLLATASNGALGSRPEMTVVGSPGPSST